MNNREEFIKKYAVLKSAPEMSKQDLDMLNEMFIKIYGKPAKETYRPYDGKLIKKMAETDIGGLPSVFFFLDFRKVHTRCHLYSSLLVYLMEDSKRVEGKVYGSGGKKVEHSWVECEDLVYDVVDRAVYEKDAYYIMHGVEDDTPMDREEDLKFARKYFEPKKAKKETMVALARDISNIQSSDREQYYKRTLDSLLEEFIKQEHLDIKDYDEGLVQELFGMLEGINEENERYATKKREEDRRSLEEER